MPDSITLARLGLNFNSIHFAYSYIGYDAPIIGDDDWLLFPDSFYDTSIELPVAGKSVALVGNGLVRGHGKLIDRHDVVIRINYPYLWARDPEHDGRRLTIWAGLGKNEVFVPQQFYNPPANLQLEDLTSELVQAEEFHCISHQHVQAGFWRKIMELGLKPRTHVHWAAPVVFEQLERSWLGRNGRFLSMITERNYHHESGYGGWYTWDTLLTGVRVAVFAALGQPSVLHLFGMNFYKDGLQVPWDMHKLEINKSLLDEMLKYCSIKGIDAAILENR